MSRGSREEEELTPLPVERGATWGALERSRAPHEGTRDEGTREGTPHPSPGFRWALGFGVLLAVLVGAGALSRVDRPRVATPVPHPRQTGEPATAASVGSDEPAPAGWRRGSPGPLFHRDQAAQVWTGTELVVWGGDPDGDSGAAYDPVTDRWRAVAAAPIPARCQGASAWTGREMLVWGRACRLTPGASPGRDRYATAGAAYDPAADRWRMLPTAPVDAGAILTSVWTGGEWVLLHPVSPTGAFDPARRRWRTLPPIPRAFASLVAQWTGTEVLVLGTEILEKGPSTVGAAYRHWTAALDPGTGRWRELPQPPLELGATAVWDGRRLIAWDQNLNAMALDPTPGRGWETMPTLPVDFTDCSPQGTMLDGVVFAEQCGQGALLRPGAKAWERIPHPRSLAEVPVWTGKNALFWVGRFAGSADGIWLYGTT